MQRRAEFIWTPDQKVAAKLSFRKIIGQGPVRRDDGQNRWYLFRKSFALANPADSAELDITVDGKYRLYVNGQQIGRGPSRCSPYYQRVDSYDINRVLSAGENTVAVLVHVYGVDTAWYETVKDYWQMLFGDGGLYSELRIEAGDASKVIVTDSSWCCIEAAAWNRDTRKSGWGQDFIEDYDARLAPVRSTRHLWPTASVERMILWPHGSRFWIVNRWDVWAMLRKLRRWHFTWRQMSRRLRPGRSILSMAVGRTDLTVLAKRDLGPTDLSVLVLGHTMSRQELKGRRLILKEVPFAS